MRALLLISLLLVACGSPPDPVSRAPGYPTEEAVELYVADWHAHRPTASLVKVNSLEDAECAQAMLVDRLSTELGEVVGYKVGLTSAATQERFGVDHPVRGVLLSGMLLVDGDTVSADFGARPFVEADFLVRIGDEGVNAATTAREVLTHVTSVIPFVELPDLALAPDETMTGTALTANNVGARLGVVGAEIPAEDSDGFHASLAEMTVVATDQTGAERSRAQGSVVLGHPLESVLWLVRSGVKLHAGDLVSVGSIGPLLPPEAGTTMSVVYEGLPGNPSVRVTFE